MPKAKPTPRPKVLRASSRKPDGAVYKQASGRSYLLWTVDMLRSARASAEAGNLRLAGELCDELMGDDRLPGLLDTRASALLGLPVAFEASGDGRRRNRVVKALEAEEDFWDLFPEPEIKAIFCWGLLLGVGLGELYPFDDEGKLRQVNGRYVPRLRHWQSKNLSLGEDGHWRLTLDGGKVLTRDAGSAPFRPGQGRWVLYQPFGCSRPWASAHWRGLAPWWLLKAYARDDWGRHSEKAATLAVESPLGVSPDLRRQLAEDLYELARDAVISLPPGFTLKSVELTANTRDIYQAQIDAANTAMAVAIAGHNLTSEVQGGSFAAAQSGQTTAGHKTKFDGESLSTFLHDQGLEPWALWNYGSRDLAPWPVYPTDPPKDKKTEASTLDVLGSAVAKLKTASRRVDVDTILESFEVPLLTEAQAEAEAAKNPAPPPPPPPGEAPPEGKEGEGEDEGPEPDEAPAPTKASARHARAPGLAPKGARAGQLYVDSVAHSSALEAARALQPDLGRVLAELEASTGPEDLERRMRELYRGLPASALAAVMERAYLLAELGGRLSVLEDS